MKIYKKNNVYEEALERIRYVFDEFENVVVGFSGGKDSTCILELSLIVAKEKNRLPLPVMWLDQEAEWQSTVDYCDEVMRRPEIKPYWMQVPFKLFNSSSFFDDWLMCWDPEQENKWVRPKSDISYKENVFGVDRFHDMFPAIENWIFDGSKEIATIYGLKANESSARKMTLTQQPAYKNITWSTRGGDHYKFAPIYDWSNTDVWVAINDMGWKYNRNYDEQYNIGIPVEKMRVSSLVHETAAEHSLLLLQELEPQTYEKLINRIGGINTYSKLMGDIRVRELPSAFSSWAEYRDYLIDTLCNEEQKKGFRDTLNNTYYKYSEKKDKVDKSICQMVLANDWTGTKIHNLRLALKLEYRNRIGYYKDKYEHKTEN